VIDSPDKNITTQEDSKEEERKDVDKSKDGEGVERVSPEQDDDEGVDLQGK